MGPLPLVDIFRYYGQILYFLGKIEFLGKAPATVFWGINEANPMGWIAEIGSSADHALKNPLLAFNTQILDIVSISKGGPKRREIGRKGKPKTGSVVK